MLNFTQQTCLAYVQLVNVCNYKWNDMVKMLCVCVWIGTSLVGEHSCNHTNSTESVCGNSCHPIPCLKVLLVLNCYSHFAAFCGSWWSLMYGCSHHCTRLLFTVARAHKNTKYILLNNNLLSGIRNERELASTQKQHAQQQPLQTRVDASWLRIQRCTCTDAAAAATAAGLPVHLAARWQMQIMSHK